MAFKFVIFCAALAAANAGIIQSGWQQPQQIYNAGWQQPQAAVIAQPAIIKKVIQAEAPANYEFNYEVHDTNTGDIKRQQEKAENGIISGQYSLLDADG